LTFWGIVFPIISNLLVTNKIITVPTNFTALIWIITAGAWYYAIFKYDFLKSKPITLKEIHNYLPVSMMVINKDLFLVEFNKRIRDNFDQYIDFENNMNLKILFPE
jgi:hypothetical protein